MTTKKTTLSIILAISLLISCGTKNKISEEDSKVAPRPAKILLLVVDTSMSMSRKNHNIFPDVKKALKSLIQPLQPGDVVQVITFADKVNFFNPIEIKSEHSKDPIYQILDGFQANGTATYFSLMLRKLFELSADVKQKYPNHYVHAVVLSDGHDYPPKGAKRISLKDYTEANADSPVKDWFVHYIAIGNLDKKIASDLKKAAPKTKVAKVDLKKDSQKDPKTAPVHTGDLQKLTGQIDKDTSQNIRDIEKAKPNFWLHPLMILLYLILILIPIVLYYRRKKKLILEGYLVYWKTEDYKPESKIIRIGDVRQGKFTIGRHKNNQYVIEDFNSNSPLIFYAAFYKSRVVPRLKWQGMTKKNFHKHVTKNPENISDGDIFSAANYTFQYSKG